jgi:ankyrin repeat protein
MEKKKQRAPRSDSKLLQACLEGNLAVVRERIMAGANINAGRKDKRPPLETAAHCGHMEIVRELIAVGADVNQIHKVNIEVFPTSALIVAIKQYKYQIAEELVRAGASAALETAPGCNAASEAAFKAIQYWWLTNDTKTTFTELAKLTATFKQLANLTVNNRPPQTFEDWFNFLKRAVNSGAKINNYCLWEACKMGCAPVVNYLISTGADVNFIAHLTSPLQIAIQNEFDETALALIAAKADPNLTEKFSHSPLKLALAKERHAIIRALLDAGATPV